MARPVGKFAKQKAECLVWLKTLMKPKCFVSNKYLAQKLGCSERQVSRYLKSLEEDGSIVRTRYRYAKRGALKTKRFVALKTVWLPALVTPPKRFEGYQRKVDEPAQVKALPPEPTPKREPTEEEIARWCKELGCPVPKKEVPPTLEERRKAEIRYLSRPKLAGVVYSAGLQAIIDKIPTKG